MKSTKFDKLIPWIIVFLAFIATSLSFLDRQVLPISIIRIKEDFPISNIEYGFINTGFLIGYAIMFTISGILIDRYGSHLGLAVSVGFWSLATGLHSLASSAIHFGIFRFLLGLGEGGAFPGAVRAVVEWVPKKRQALANGIAIGGGSAWRSICSSSVPRAYQYHRMARIIFSHLCHRAGVGNRMAAGFEEKIQ